MFEVSFYASYLKIETVFLDVLVFVQKMSLRAGEREKV
jgi:hypothetical protein